MRMKCYYEILEVPRDVNSEDLKKAYRKLAIKWHPDKNLDNTENATEQFKLIQQAFEVLSDPHERAWYDDHRDAILKGKSSTEYEDECLDIFQYFTPSCYQGFGDDEKGFYSVYREVFNTIAAEDSEFEKGDDSDFEIPSFGRSDSPYEDVKKFYDHWQSYYTKKTFSFLDIYDFRQAPNRKVLRLMEKENKKIRDKARKARSDEVKELVKFVRKRDKRVQAYAQHLLEISAEKARKLEEMRIAKIKARNSELASQKESEWAKFSNFENQLKDIEANLASEFGEMSSENSETEEYNFDENLYCPACNKVFKTKKALQNHERSKKHKENVKILKENMVDLDQCSEKYSSGEEDARSDLVEGSILENNSENSNEISDDGDEDFFLQSEDGNFKTEEPNSIPDIEYLYCKLCGVNMKQDEENEHKKSEKHLNNRKLYDDLKRQLGSDTEADCDDISGSSASESSDFLNENESGNEIFKNSKALKKQTNENFFKLKKIDKVKMDKEIEGMCAKLDDILDKNELYLKEHDSETSSNSKKEIKNKVPPINNIKIDDKVTNILLDRKSELTDKQMNKLFDLIKLEKNEFITNIKPEHIEDFGIGHFSEEMNKISEEIDKLTKKKSKPQRNKISKHNNFFEISDDDNDFSLKKQKKKSKLKQSKTKNKNSSENDPHLEIGKNTDDEKHKSVSPDQGKPSSLLESDNGSLRPSTKKTLSKVRHSKMIDDHTVDEEKISTSCAVCKASFPSKNKLFQHLTKTGHSVYLPEKCNKSQESDTDYCKKGKGKKNRK